jgi:acyl-CoA dehydrogenase
VAGRADREYLAFAVTSHPSALRQAATGDDALSAARSIAAEVASRYAADVDRQAAFPADTIGALAGAGLLAAIVPAESGGQGLSLRTLSRIAIALARGCGSSSMIWAMHQLQLGCVVRHCWPASQQASDLLSAVVADGLLLASVTSEKGIGGDLRRSLACVEADGAGRRLLKDSPTVSYGQQAGAFLITARRGPAAAEDDQVAVVVLAGQVELSQTSGWNPMGMRGTCSPGFRLLARFGPGLILPDPFAVVAERTLIPLSEILWSSVWIGLATEALSRAAQCVAERVSRSSAAADPRLAWADQILTGLEAQLDDAIARFDAVDRGECAADQAFRARLHALKLAASTSTIDIAQHALALCGFAGYSEDGPFSVSRLLRDLYSAQVMVSNDRLLAANAKHAMRARAAGVARPAAADTAPGSG